MMYLSVIYMFALRRSDGSSTQDKFFIVRQYRIIETVECVFHK